MGENLDFLMEKALGHYKSFLIDTSIREFRSIIAQFPNHVDAHLYLSYALEKKALQNNENAFFILALNEAKEALKLDTHNKEIHNQIINLYHKTDKLDGAVGEYKKYAENEPENKLWQDCLKQITVLSSFKAESKLGTIEKTPRSSFSWVMIIAIMAFVILLIMLFVFRYLQMKSQ